MARSTTVSRDAVMAATTRLLGAKAAASDTQRTYELLASGRQYWGAGGSTAPDVNMERVSAGKLGIHGSLAIDTFLEVTAQAHMFNDLAVDGVIYGIGGVPIGPYQKQPVRVAMLTNVNTASPGATLDGVTMVAGDRVLLVGQTTGSQNGIYTWATSASAMTRATDADVAADFVYGFGVQVIEGQTNTGIYTHITTGAITLGTTTIRFANSTTGPELSHNAGDHGLLGWNFDPINHAATGFAFTTGQPQMIRIKVPRTITITNVHVGVDVVGAGLTANQNFVAIVDQDGTRLAVSANGIAEAQLTTVGFRTIPLSSTVQVIGSPTKYIYVYLLFRGTTMPQIVRTNNAQAAVGNANLSATSATAGARSAFSTTTQTSVPSPVTLSQFQVNAQNFWVALS